MSSPSAAATPATGLITALQDVLAREHEAVYGLSVVGVNLADQAQVAHVRHSQAAHRQTRDLLMAELVAGGHTPVAAQPSYQPPQNVHDVSTAQRWAMQLEQGCAAAYRYLLAQTATTSGSGATSRKAALDGLSASASAALYWRRLLTPDTPTERFPGT